MKRFSVLFTLLAALLLFQEVHAQETVKTTYNFDVVSAPDSLHAKCIPFVGESVTVMASQLYKTDANVTLLLHDKVRSVYVMVLEKKLWLFIELDQCATIEQDFYAWKRMEGNTVTQLPVFVFPNGISRELESYFLKESR